MVEPRSKIQSEVVVEFPSAAIRDYIKSSGYKLEGQQAGIRMEIPNYLKSDFHVLQNLSYRLKMANTEMKRSIKFDDERYGIMLDIQLPDQEWRRIRPDQARDARRMEPSLREGPLELSGDMIAGVVRSSNPSVGGDNSSNSASDSVVDPTAMGTAASGSNATPLGRRST